MTPHNNWIEKSVPNDLIIAKELIYDRHKLECTIPLSEPESQDYNAFRFTLNSIKICYRTAKITPTKTGQFVTLWKRNKDKIIEPFDSDDPIDAVIVSVRKENDLGQFIFPKHILLKEGVFSTSNKEGKRAIRVYPPWDETTSKQAQKTQQWQLKYFFWITAEKSHLITDFLHNTIEKT
ncbi:MepB family protein [Flavobacterium sp. Fl-77]|uniref:MepB family protein n=1 Tax=Flavobacterium flavipigmentatum TaxID=2893884 RepID=A0AAJ2S814_9FLAO|nr:MULTISPECIES: MepB family protein [unclassified Flavobacterium]MDX6182501.1 MepB family protein [Flavobacterium sp. Fl-33]MDX6185586.1 MepB family protein [Flavobacterium sp. Fl-77]UFH38774.1 MepB family protein [Flavobacterium sp. F-70]